MNDFDVYEAILHPITYNDLVLMAQNINPASGRTLRGELEELLRSKVEETLELFDLHEQEIYAEAFPDEYNEPENPLGEEVTEALAHDIYRFLLEHEMWIDTAIYYNGKRMSTMTVGKDRRPYFRYNGEPFYDEANPRDYFDYVSPILSMSFEGPLYDCMNYGGEYGWDIVNKFETLLKKYGLYYELGNAWDLGVYKI